MSIVSYKSTFMLSVQVYRCNWTLKLARLLFCGPRTWRLLPGSTTMLHQTRGPNWYPLCASRQWEVYVPSITGATNATLTTPTCPGSSKGTGTSLFSSDARPRFPHMNTSCVHAHTYTKHKIGIHMRKKNRDKCMQPKWHNKERAQGMNTPTQTQKDIQTMAHTWFFNWNHGST